MLDYYLTEQPDRRDLRDDQLLARLGDDLPTLGQDVDVDLNISVKDKYLGLNETSGSCTYELVTSVRRMDRILVACMY